MFFRTFGNITVQTNQYQKNHNSKRFAYIAQKRSNLYKTTKKTIFQLASINDRSLSLIKGFTNRSLSLIENLCHSISGRNILLLIHFHLEVFYNSLLLLNPFERSECRTCISSSPFTISLDRSLLQISQIEKFYRQQKSFLIDRFLCLSVIKENIGKIKF